VTDTIAANAVIGIATIAEQGHDAVTKRVRRDGRMNKRNSESSKVVERWTRMRSRNRPRCSTIPTTGTPPDRAATDPLRSHDSE
jgi:hypothetical protein